MSDITPDPTYRRELKERVRTEFALAEWWRSRSEATREAMRQNDYQPTNNAMAMSLGEAAGSLVEPLPGHWILAEVDSEALRQIDQENRPA